MQVSVDQVHLPDFQIRSSLDQEHVDEIAESFQQDGQWNPIIVRPDGEDGYEVVSGAHRLSAAEQIGWSEIDAVVKDLSDEDARGLAVKTNRMQKRMEDEEEGELCKELYTEYDMTEEEIGEITGMAPRTVQDKITLVMDLADSVYKKVKSGDLAARKGLVIAQLPQEDQPEFTRRLQENGWSRDEARAQLERFQNDTIYTTGYSGLSISELVEHLEEAEIEVLVDVRRSGESMYKPEFNSDVLENHFSNEDIDYEHRPEMGVPQNIVTPYKEQAIGHKCFRDWYNWSIHQDERFEELAEFVKESGKCALMCIEKYPEPEDEQEHYCHRHHLAEELIDEGYFRKREDIVPGGTSLTDFA